MWRDLDRIGDRLADWQWALPPDAVLERLPVDELEHDVRPRVGGIPVVAGVDDTDDVWVGQLRDGAGLTTEALQLIGVGGDLAMHELDRDRALQRLVGRPVDG